jgi:type II secretory pathway component PulM
MRQDLEIIVKNILVRGKRLAIFLKKIRAAIIRSSKTSGSLWSGIGVALHKFPLTRTEPFSGGVKGALNQFYKLMIRHYRTLLICCSLCILWVIILIWLTPYSAKIQGKIDLYPAQWNHFQGLLKASDVNQAPASTVAMLGDIELENIRGALRRHGLKPNVIRLGSEMPPHLEFQANDLIFSVLIDVLQELRASWHLYPDHLSIVATPMIGMVNVSASLIQVRSSTLEPLSEAP